MQEDRKTRIRTVFLHPDTARPCWPNIGYDFESKIEEVLAALRKQCPECEFEPVQSSDGSPEEGRRIAAEAGDADGFLIYYTGCLWGELPDEVAAAGRPTVLADHLFAGSGAFLTAYARLRRKGLPAAGVSSSDFGDLLRAVKGIDAVRRLRDSVLLVVGDEPDPAIERVYGTGVRRIDFEEVNARYEGLSAGGPGQETGGPGDSAGARENDSARQTAERWKTEAEEVAEPAEETLQESGRMYAVLAELMEERGAEAVTVNCLGGIYGGQMAAAYPCLAFMELDNRGLVGACEADQRAAMTKLILSYLTGRPGFISDPVIDTAANRIIYAHCTAATRAYGPQGAASPYRLRDHSEDRRGAAVQTYLPVGETVTTVLFDHRRRQVIFHQGRAVENVEEDKGCRTKLAAEVCGDIRKLLRHWDQWGWHRVTVYGDWKREIEEFADLIGFELMPEA
jgi:L-fucose isomerase-like protein